MSLPPVTVRIKRKATDEPVEILRVHESSGKRQRRATDFVFSRQPTPDTSNDPARSQPGFQDVRRIKQVHRSASSQVLGAKAAQRVIPSTPTTEQRSESPSGANTPSTSTLPTKPAFGPTQTRPASVPPRRFHISRAPTNPASIGPVTGLSRKRKAEPTIFVERRGRPRSSEAIETARDHNGAIQAGIAEGSYQSRVQKKPGLAARTSTPPVKPSPPRSASTQKPQNISFPSGLMMRWDVNDEQLAAEMEAYTLQEIGRTLAESVAPKPETHHLSSRKHSNTTSKFKPKKPALRYLERHPGERVELKTEMELDETLVDHDDQIDEDSEYIIDTYVRIPVEALESMDDQQRFGLLVLDSQPDIDEFYRDLTDSDEEEEEEEEDENAENHYTADYPDDEVASDDEFDRNPYHYRTHNASDLEEFDENDAAFSDNDSTKYPWAKKPWMTLPSDEVMIDDDGEAEK